MKKEDIGQRVKEVIAWHLEVPVAKIGDEMVVGKMLIDDENFKIDFSSRIPISDFSYSQWTTVKELVASLERAYDALPPRELQ